MKILLKTPKFKFYFTVFDLLIPFWRLLQSVFDLNAIDSDYFKFQGREEKTGMADWRKPLRELLGDYPYIIDYIFEGQEQSPYRILNPMAFLCLLMVGDMEDPENHIILPSPDPLKFLEKQVHIPHALT